MTNNTYRLQNCQCLRGCSEVEYKFFVASAHKFTNDEVDELCKSYGSHQLPHSVYIRAEIDAIAEHKLLKNLSKDARDLAEEVCKSYIKNEYAHVRVRIDGSTFVRTGAGLKYSIADKFALIGGTLGLFTGFSLLVMFEGILWLFITIMRIFFPKLASSKVDPEAPKPQEDIKGEMMKSLKILKEENESWKKQMLEENQGLKKQMLEMKELLIAKGILPNTSIDQEPLTVVCIEEI